MAAVAQIENLGKRYEIRHQAGATYREDVFRDVLAGSAARLGRKLIGPFAKREESRPSREKFWALRDVSFDVAAGEKVAVIGRNGAGKSTLLKILSRITEPTAGRVTLRGRVASLLEVGTGFHPELTGRENIFLNGAILGMTRGEIKRKFDDIVEFSEIEMFLDTPVKRYSSGMYVRLAFAVAAHLEPEILLVDEVLAVGDASFQKKCLGKMGDVAREGRTVIFVSHNMAAVVQLCERAVWLDGGAVQMIGPAAKVVQNYISGGSSQVAERKWSHPGDAPGDDRVRLLGCRILQAEDVTPVVDINRPFAVELTFRVLQNARDLVTGISFYNTDTTCLFNSCDWRPNRLDPGVYTKRLEIPSQLLAEGLVNVLVQLVFYDPDVRSVVLNDVLTFDAMESEDPAAVRGLYKGSWPGVVRPRLPWTDAVSAAGGD